MSQERERQDYIWLVKSNSSVLGPYKFDEVVDFIFKGDIHVLDEIKGPFERWRPIRDHSLFNAAIEKLKATTYARREYTVTDTLDVNAAETTQTITHTIGNLDDTQTITNDGGKAESAGKSTSSTAAPSSELERRNVRLPLPNQVVPEPPKVYPAPPSKPKPSQFPIAFFLTLIIIIGGTVIYTLVGVQGPDSHPPLANQNFAGSFDLGNTYLERGEEDRALESLKNAYLANDKNPDLNTKLAALLLHYDEKVGGQTGSQLAVSLASQVSPHEMDQVNLVLALDYSYKDNANLAIESLKKALDINDKNQAALINIGYEYIRIKKPESAIDYLTDAIRLRGEGRGIALFLLIRAYIEAARKMESLGFLETDAFAKSDRYIQNQTSPFHQEILFLRAVAAKYLNQKPEESGLVDMFLAVDPMRTSLHKKNIFWNRNIYLWSDLDALCTDLANSLSPYKREIVRGFCAFKKNSTAEAKKILDDLANQKGDGLLMGLKAAVEIEREESGGEQAMLLLKNVSITNPQLLVNVTVRDCLIRGNENCIRSVYSQYEKSIDLIYKYWALAYLNKNVDTVAFSDNIKQAMELSDVGFIPLLIMRDN